GITVSVAGRRQQVAPDRLPQLRRPVDGGVLRLAGLDRADRSGLDVIRRVEIRFADGEVVDRASLGLQLAHARRRGGARGLADPPNAGGGGERRVGHRAPRPWWGSTASRSVVRPFAGSTSVRPQSSTVEAPALYRSISSRSFSSRRCDSSVTRSTSCCSTPTTPAPPRSRTPAPPGRTSRPPVPSGWSSGPSVSLPVPVMLMLVEKTGSPGARRWTVSRTPLSVTTGALPFAFAAWPRTSPNVP